jgi:hypothetical protein
MSKLRDTEKKKKELQEENDNLLEIGKEGKAGDKAFKDFQNLTEAESKIKRDIVLDEVEMKKRTRGYHKFLTDLLTERLHTVFFPMGWTHIEAPSDRGVVMELKSPDGRIFRTAFAAVKDPIYDLNAIDSFALRAENTIYEKSKTNGIIT